MEVILISICSAIIIFITVYSIIRVLNIVNKREEISHRKYKTLITFSVVIGLFVVSTLPFGFQKIFNMVI